MGIATCVERRPFGKLLILFPEETAQKDKERRASLNTRFEALHQGFAGTEWEAALAALHRSTLTRALIFRPGGVIIAVISTDFSRNARHVAALVAHAMMLRLTAPQARAGRSPTVTPDGGLLCGLGTRGFAAAIDLTVSIAVTLSVAYRWNPRCTLYNLVVIFFAVTVLSSALMEGLCKATLGKLACAMEVRQLCGGTLGWRGALTRNVLRPFDMAGGYAVAALFATLSQYYQSLGDRAARSVVVKVQRSPAQSRAAVAMLLLVVAASALPTVRVGPRVLGDHFSWRPPVPEPMAVSDDLWSRRVTVVGGGSDLGPTFDTISAGDQISTKLAFERIPTNWFGFGNLTLTYQLMDPLGASMGPERIYRNGATGTTEELTLTRTLPDYAMGGFYTYHFVAKEHSTGQELRFQRSFYVQSSSENCFQPTISVLEQKTQDEYASSSPSLDVSTAGPASLHTRVCGLASKNGHVDAAMDLQIVDSRGVSVYIKRDCVVFRKDLPAYAPPSFWLGQFLTISAGMTNGIKGPYTVLLTLHDHISGKNDLSSIPLQVHSLVL